MINKPTGKVIVQMENKIKFSGLTKYRGQAICKNKTDFLRNMGRIYDAVARNPELKSTIIVEKGN